ncbi:MAG: radical SAM protein [Helicobacter sp.]|nr:radical SAM protein [Helicobacter sp.]
MLQTKEDIQKRLGIKDYELIHTFPKFFEIETINACNAKCVMCTVEEWNGNTKKVMSDALWQKFVLNVKPYKDWIEKITLTRDGEPLLDKKLCFRIRDLKEAGIEKVAIVTNVQLLNHQRALELLESGLDEIMFSIDGISKEVFESIRVGLNYERVLDNALNFIDLRDKNASNLKIRVRFIEQKLNSNEVPKWLEFWKSKVSSGDSVYVMPLHSWGNQLLTESEDKVVALANYACISPFSSMAMHFDGKVGICGVDYGSKHFVGDFSLSSIEDIWRGGEFNSIREKHLNKRRNEIWLCRGCDLWDRIYKY